MRIAIAGTCGLAQHIARGALSRGHEVVLLSRDEHPELLPLVTIRIDYADPSSLAAALAGVDTLISTINHAAPQLALIDACLSARVRRFAPAEFEGLLDIRPLAAPNSHRFDVLNRLREEKHRLDSTVFVCGLLMERFSPGGLVGSGTCSAGGVLKGEAAFLLDFREATGWIPAGEGVAACFIAAEDLGAFVARALDVGVWPEQWRCCGERLLLKDVVRIAEEVKGTRFEVKETHWEELQDLLLENEDKNAPEEAARIDMLMAIQRGEFDFGAEADLNLMFPEVRTIGLREWLQRAWDDVEL
ncbi:hypothetical protein FN846DRAFT_908498 [Sphaerosporella brunnea]|uniref:NmrA-like domain-containing protein n=1 Tax=Sphaerosporella brunnea TaxID=1250544 RepID=A0A5J5ETZ0_9PEZI|nr:hypothetical protein FN846DRAFT_908498 [Sphaerosporella brunnea]